MRSQRQDMAHLMMGELIILITNILMFTIIMVTIIMVTIVREHRCMVIMVTICKEQTCTCSRGCVGEMSRVPNYEVWHFV